MHFKCLINKIWFDLGMLFLRGCCRWGNLVGSRFWFSSFCRNRLFIIRHNEHKRILTISTLLYLAVFFSSWWGKHAANQPGGFAKTRIVRLSSTCVLYLIGGVSSGFMFWLVFCCAQEVPADTIVQLSLASKDNISYFKGVCTHSVMGE